MPVHTGSTCESPYRYRTNGIGIIATLIPPNTEHARPTPKFLKNAVENNGKPAPTDDRNRSFPASTDAAYFG